MRSSQGSSEHAGTSGTLTCCLCGVVIGAYEPMVLVSEGQARVTSQASEPDAAAHSGAKYHEGCYARLPRPESEG